MNDSVMELSKHAKSKLETVPRDSSEYVDVMLHLGNLDVLSVFKISNEDLDMQYAVAMSAVSQLDVVRVLHGTSTDSVDAIVCHGFKVGGDGVPVRNGQAHGTGVYLTTDPHYAAGYARKRNCKYLIMSELCRTSQCVTDGERSNKNSLPVIETHPKLYNVYVQPQKDLVRPLYVVEFGQCQRMKKSQPEIPQQPVNEQPPIAEASLLKHMFTKSSYAQAPAPNDTPVLCTEQNQIKLETSTTTNHVGSNDQAEAEIATEPEQNDISAEPQSLTTTKIPGKPSTKIIAKYFDIPDEITKSIFTNLDACSLAQAREVCRKWNDFASEETVWKTLCIQEWQALGTDPHLKRVFSPRSWRKVYPRVHDAVKWSFTLSKNKKFMCNINASLLKGTIHTDPLPETLQVSRRFNVQHLEIFILPDAAVFYLEPKTQDDEDGFQDFIEYLQRRSRAGLALVEHERFIFIPPGQYLAEHLKYGGDNLIAVVQNAYPPLAP